MRERQPMIRRPGPPEDPEAFTRMQARLKELTGAPVNPPTYRDEPDREVKPVTQTVQLPMGYNLEPPALEWLSPVKGCQISAGGQYEVRGRRSGEGWAFTAYRGLDALGEPQTTAQEARDIALAHYREASGVPL